MESLAYGPSESGGDFRTGGTGGDYRVPVSYTHLDVYKRQSLYGKYDVKRGLRDVNGAGVLAGLTEISDVVSFKNIDGVKTPCDCLLYTSRCV